MNIPDLRPLGPSPQLHSYPLVELTALQFGVFVPKCLFMQFLPVQLSVLLYLFKPHTDGATPSVSPCTLPFLLLPLPCP